MIKPYPYIQIAEVDDFIAAFRQFRRSEFLKKNLSNPERVMSWNVSMRFLITDFLKLRDEANITIVALNEFGLKSFNNLFWLEKPAVENDYLQVDIGVEFDVVTPAFTKSTVAFDGDSIFHNPLPKRFDFKTFQAFNLLPKNCVSVTLAEKCVYIPMFMEDGLNCGVFALVHVFQFMKCVFRAGIRKAGLSVVKEMRQKVFEWRPEERLQSGRASSVQVSVSVDATMAKDLDVESGDEVEINEEESVEQEDEVNDLADGETTEEESA
eukprot:augustus_masked-scaffold_76-processed-gene-0.77-mRNA-1 protein AED:1.00 eAED:1.00 QI:0/0/0/0/1/1/2/0/266